MRIPTNVDTYTISNIEDLNTTFARGQLWVMYVGKNRNHTYFSKEAIQEALPTLFNVPIVANWKREDNTIGGHDMQVVSDDGGMRLINMTEPCGVVPESATFRFESKPDASGSVHEYLVIDNVLLWKRQDVYRHIMNDLKGNVKHSMEVNVGASQRRDDGNIGIDKFEFTALCLLEEADPCFEGSELSVNESSMQFSLDAFKQKMEEMMSDMRACFSEIASQIVPQGGCDDIYNECLKEGGTTMEECAINEVVVEPVVEDVTPEVADDVATPEDQNGEVEAESNDEHENFSLGENVRQELCDTLSDAGYYLCDYDAEISEVYYINDSLKLYGAPYTFEGDKCLINFDECKRKKWAIVDYVDGESIETEAFGVVCERCDALREDLAEYQNRAGELESENANLKCELETLRQFKLDYDTDCARKEREVVLSQFGDLENDECFTKLVENCLSYSVEDLEEKCYAIRGRRVAFGKANFSVNNGVRIVVDDVNDKVDKQEPYGGLFVKYSK